MRGRDFSCKAVCVIGAVMQGASPASSQDCDMFLKKTQLCACLLVVF
jgi:hypothetical protein